MVFRKLSALLVILLWALTVCGQQTIRLKQQKIPYRPVNYAITDVVDDRADTTSIGTIRTGLSGKKTSVDLQGGMANAIHAFLKNNLDQDTSKTHVSLHIVSLELSEKNVGFKEQADLSMNVAFYINGRELISYGGSAYIQTTQDVTRYAEQLIRQNLERCIKELDDWWIKNKDALTGEPAIRANVVIARTTADEDEIVYTHNPLTWADFQGKPDPLTIADAATSSGFTLSSESRTVNNKMSLTLTLKPVFNKKKSWYKLHGKNPASLRHEQLHFDITAIIVCAFANELKNTSFSIDNLSRDVEKLQKKYLQQLEDMQNAYDDETEHGTNAEKQKEWDNTIQSQLAAADCY